MPRCPNCSYVLVLLSHRRRYKCAKCSSLFSEKFIDDRNFRNFNKRQREEDKLSLKQKKPKMSENERLQKREAYRTKNRERIRAKERENWHKGLRKDYMKEYYRRDIDRSRLIKRIRFYRLRQKQLALKMLKNEGYSSYGEGLFISPPTLALSYLLK